MPYNTTNTNPDHKDVKIKNKSNHTCQLRKAQHKFDEWLAGLI